MADRPVATNVEHLAVAAVAGAGTKKCIGRIVDVDEIAQLRTVAEDLNRLVLERETDEPADEALAIVTNQLPRAVDIGQAQRAGAHAEDVVVDEMVVLAGRLVDAIDIGRSNQVRLTDRQRIGTAVDLT